ALVDGRTIWRSRRDGSWEQLASLPYPGTCLAPMTAGLLVGTAGAHLLRLEKGRLARVEPLEEVEGRHEWYTPWGEPPDTRSISTDAAGAVYVNVHVGGVVRSTDRGRSWQPTLDIHTDVHQVLAHPARARLVLAAAAVGLGVSSDRGGSWRFETDGLHARYLRAVAVAGDRVLVSASTGPEGTRAALYRKRLGQNERFERCRQGLPEWFTSNIDTSCLAASGATAAFGTDEGLLFCSTDGGRSWEIVSKDLPRVRCVSIG
ncbi:MAG: hypothetical protein ACE5FK_05100, partial [Candidatus Methylomirabilia bacterium]